MTDLLVIGGGAAGLMAAGAACARGLTVTVLEHNPKGPGRRPPRLPSGPPRRRR